MAGCAHAQVIEPEIGRQVGLVVAVKKRGGFGDVGPFREALSPPLVVFRDRMELRQVEGDKTRGVWALCQSSVCRVSVGSQWPAIVSTTGRGIPG